jgi:hypothetical protein
MFSCLCARRARMTGKPEVTARTTALNWKSKFSTHNPTHSKTYSRNGSRYLLARTTMPRCYTKAFMLQSSSSRLSAPWLKVYSLLCRVLHCCAAVKQREVLAIAPHLCQVPIVRAVRVAGLAGVVDGDRIVPIANVDHHAYRRTAHLAKIADAVRRLTRHKSTPVLLDWSNVYLGARASSKIAEKGCSLRLYCSLPQFHFCVSGPCSFSISS